MLTRSKEWWLARARLEGDSCVTAGVPDGPLATPTPQPPEDAAAMPTREADIRRVAASHYYKPSAFPWSVSDWIETGRDERDDVDQDVRDLARAMGHIYDMGRKDAADDRERLRGEVERLREALAPFAEASATIPATVHPKAVIYMPGDTSYTRVRVECFRDAVAALAPAEVG